MKDNELNEQEERDTKNPKPDRETALQAELNELKTQLDDLRDSGPPDSGSDVPPGTVGATEASVSIPGDAPDQSDSEAAEGLAGDLASQVRGLAEGMSRDLKQAHPITLLAVFALGVLFGRLLRR